MKKWLFPLAYPIISIISFILSGVVGVLGKGDGTGYGGVVIVLLGLIIYCVILIPAMCILYSKRCLLGQRGRFFFTLYQALLITLPCLIWSLKVNGAVVYSLVLFVWCEIWGLIGLIRLRRKKRVNSFAEQS